MKKWILFILLINPKLDKLCDSLDKKTERLALNLARAPLTLCEEIFECNDRKIRLINLRVLHNQMLTGLCENEREALLYRSDKETDRSTLFRRRERAIEKCERTLARLGYDELKLLADYPKTLFGAA